MTRNWFSDGLLLIRFENLISGLSFDKSNFLTRGVLRAIDVLTYRILTYRIPAFKEALLLRGFWLRSWAALGYVHCAKQVEFNTKDVEFDNQIDMWTACEPSCWNTNRSYAQTDNTTGLQKIKQQVGLMESLLHSVRWLATDVKVIKGLEVDLCNH